MESQGAMARAEIQQKIADVMDDVEYAEVIRALRHYLDRHTAAIQHDAIKQRHLKAMELLEAAAKALES